MGISDVLKSVDPLIISLKSCFIVLVHENKRSLNVLLGGYLACLMYFKAFICGRSERLSCPHNALKKFTAAADSIRSLSLGSGFVMGGGGKYF